MTAKEFADKLLAECPHDAAVYVADWNADWDEDYALPEPADIVPIFDKNPGIICISSAYQLADRAAAKATSDENAEARRQAHKTTWLGVTPEYADQQNWTDGVPESDTIVTVAKAEYPLRIPEGASMYGLDVCEGGEVYLNPDMRCTEVTMLGGELHSPIDGEPFMIDKGSP